MRSASVGTKRLLAMALAALVTACSHAQNPLEQNRLEYSHLTNATRTEARNLEQFRAQEQRLERVRPKPAPAPQPIPPAFNPLDESVVSVSMQDQPLHDVLYVVARNAGLNLVIEPDISLDHRLTISFESAPSSTVVEHLLRAYDLGYEVRDNVLYVKRFQEKAFDLGYMNMRSEVLIDNGGDIYGSSGVESGDSGLQGNFQIASSLGKGVEERSLYDLLLVNVRQILDVEGDDYSSDYGSFSLDPVGGHFYVRTTPRRMRAVSELLSDLRTKMSKQVVIDARILEVELRDEYHLGVQWNYVLDQLVNGLQTNLSVGNLVLDATGNVVTVVPSRPGAMYLDYQESNADETIRTTIQALQEFGGVRTVSNPLIRARHGQPALITSGTTVTYISEITKDVDENNGVQTTTYTPETERAFSGIMLGVYPFINDKNEIDLQIFPIKSQVDLTNQVDFDNISISLPSVDVQNLLTSLHVNDGDTIILGGLIDKGHTKSDGGVPGLMSIPLVGQLFRQESRVESVKELVIIMHVRLLG